MQLQGGQCCCCRDSAALVGSMLLSVWTMLLCWGRRCFGGDGAAVAGSLLFQLSHVAFRRDSGALAGTVLLDGEDDCGYRLF